MWKSEVDLGVFPTAWISEMVSHRAYSLLFWLGLLSQAPRPLVSPSPGSGVAGMHHYVLFLCAEIRSSCLPDKHSNVLSHLPSPMLMIWTGHTRPIPEPARTTQNHPIAFYPVEGEVKERAMIHSQLTHRADQCHGQVQTLHWIWIDHTWNICLYCYIIYKNLGVRCWGRNLIDQESSRETTSWPSSPYQIKKVGTLPKPSLSLSVPLCLGPPKSLWLILAS